MNKQKKVFGISKSLSTGLSETINAVKNHAGMFRYEVIALSRIETDPDNPRDLLITVEDIIQGIDKNSPHYEKKSNEFESLKSLSETIKAKGIINPVVVYPFQNKYRLVAGERRFLASHVAGKQDIQAKVLDEKPNKLNLRQLQWIENTEREDLSLKDRLVNIKLIVDEYQQEKGHCKMTSLLLKDLIGVSTQQANNYLVAITASDDLLEQINLEKINSLD
ncbi:MAG: ParB/RepB/Spo0J family partition protein, partial [Proteobacteria bacterium]|nr:ParB/RepB/Spo0J family partition protein [Pseudomonadota bacterium]